MASTFSQLVTQEKIRARELHPPYNSMHEAYAVLLEEVDEFWDEVRKKSSERNPQDVLDELVQIATVAQLTAEDLSLVPALPPAPEDQERFYAEKYEELSRAVAQFFFDAQIRTVSSKIQPNVEIETTPASLMSVTVPYYNLDQLRQLIQDDRVLPA